jgi:hypothetical protein
MIAMRRVITALTLAAVAALSSCISVPVAAKASNGMKFVGDATAPLFSPVGNVTLYSDTGNLKVTATWNPLDPRPTIRVPFQVSDGRYGVATVVRDASGMNGTGVGQANDGTTFTYYMGNNVAVPQFRTEW